MKKLIKDLKTQGFKVGLYSSAGDYTQSNGQKNPGSYNYEYADAYLFNSWGIDYLEYGEGLFKSDTKPGSAVSRFAQMSYSLDNVR